MDGYDVGEQALKDIAEGLRVGGETLRLRRPHPTPHPDAGRSTNEAFAAIDHLVAATADLSRLCLAMSGRIEECLEDYRRVDAAVAAEFERIARRGR